jgi:hypothetical protein
MALGMIVVSMGIAVVQVFAPHAGGTRVSEAPQPEVVPLRLK